LRKLRPAPAILIVAVLAVAPFGQADAGVPGSKRATAACRPATGLAVKRMNRAVRALTRRARHLRRSARVSAAARHPRLASGHRRRLARVTKRLHRVRGARRQCRLAAAERRVKPGPTPAPGAIRVGLVTGYAKDVREVDWVTHLSARIMRHEFKAGPDAWDDSFYRLTTQRGITVVPLINTKPVPATDAAREAFAGMVAAHVRRFGPHGTFWDANPQLDRSLAPRVFEVMNEPYIEAMGGPYNPAGYAALVRRTAELVRAVDPDARIAMATATTYWGGADSGKPWLGALYDAEPRLNDYFDVAAVHPYGHDPDRCDRTDRWCFRQIEVVKSILNARGGGGKKLYITEVGNNTAGPSSHTETEQAKFLQRYVELAKGYGYVEALLYYRYQDLCADTTNKECWFGVIRGNGTLKPAFSTLRQAILANP
jgi:hypothetical protein